MITGHDYNDAWRSVVMAVNEKFVKPDYLFNNGNWVYIKK